MSVNAHMVARYRFWLAQLAAGFAPQALQECAYVQARAAAALLIGQGCEPLRRPAGPMPVQGDLWG